MSNGRLPQKYLRKERPSQLKMKILVPVILLCAALSGCGGREADLLLKEVSEEDAVSAESADAGVKEPSKAPEVTAEPEEIYVDVCGAVARPGVFALESGSRVYQALEAAGGILPEGSAVFINQAQILTDGQQVYVPTQEEAEQQGDSPPGLSAGGASAGSGDETSGKVNINTADETQLTTLSGIGPSKAQAIIAYREENGGFSSIEEIMNVQGIKEGTFGKIKDDIAVE